MAMTQRYGFHFHLADRRDHLHGVGLFADRCRCSRRPCCLCAELPHARDRVDAEAAGARAGRRLDQRAHRGDHLRHRRHHRRRGDADRARPEVLGDRDRLCRRQPAADRALHGAGGLDRRARRAGDGVLHHLRRDRRAGDDQARRAAIAAHMFIFYYSVLSEVSPPTALSPFAAAAITGGDPYATTLQAWKYTLPAFLVPFVFVLDPQGIGLLLTDPEGGSWIDVGADHAKTGARAVALAAAAQGWAIRRTTPDRARCCWSWPGFAWCSRACSRRCWRRHHRPRLSSIRRHLAW